MGQHCLLICKNGARRLPLQGRGVGAARNAVKCMTGSNHKTPLLAVLFLWSLWVVAPGRAEQQPAQLARPAAPPATLHDMPLLFHDDFQSDKITRWQPTDSAAWQLLEQGENVVLSLVKDESDYQPPVRSPLNRSLVRDLTVGDFVLDVRLQSTTRDYPHRSLCLFFGYQDDAHLYYVHFGQEADDHANQIFIVNGAPRTKISTTTTSGTKWDNAWHHARIVRNVDTGKIAVYFDNMSQPAMTATDATFTWGQVGVGSFDDTGNFDHVLVYGQRVSSPPAN